MNPTALLDHLAARGVRFSVTAGRLRVDAPTGVLTPGIADELRRQRAIVIAVVLGWTTGHVLSPCSACGQVSMTQHSPDTWPTCRMTTGCPGRHAPERLHHTIKASTW